MIFSNLLNQAYTTNGFATFANTTEGIRMFPIPHNTNRRSTITIAARHCMDPRGCPCGNDVENVSTPTQILWSRTKLNHKSIILYEKEHDKQK